MICNNCGSLNGGPRNSIPTGTPIGALSVGVENPAGTVMAGNPVIEARMPLRSAWFMSPIITGRRF